MKFVLTYASDIDDSKMRVVDLKTLEELLELVEKEKHAIIVYGEGNMMVYDDYL